MAENVRVITVDTGVAQTSVKELRNQLKQLKDTLLSTEKGTEEYNEALQQAADIQHTLKEQTEELNASAMDFGQITGNLVKATGGLVAGLQAVKASMNLLGVENEDVIKSMEKMQNLMALTQALPSIDNGVKAFKRLGLAIKSAASATGALGKALMVSGIGLAVTLVASLAANWDEFSESIGLSQKKLEKFGDIAQGVLNVVLKAVGGVGTAISRIIRGDFKGAKEATKEAIAFSDNYNEGVQKSIEARITKAKELEKQAAKEAKDRKQKELEEYRKRENEKLDILLERNKRTKQSEEESIKEQIRIETERLKFIQEGSLEYEQQLTKIQSLEDSVDALKKKEQEALDAEKKKTEELEKQEALRKQKEAESLLNKYGADKTLAEQESDAINEIQKAYEQDVINFEQCEELKAQIHKKYKDIQVQEEYDKYASIVQVATSALNSIGSIFSDLANAQDAQTKEGFEEQKKYQIAAATMDMLGGLVSAWVSAMNPANAWMTIWGQLAMGAASSAAILTTGLLNIDKIKKQTFGGGSTGGATNAASIGTLIAPVQYTQDVQGASIEGAIKDTKVYVTETDISNTQNKVKVTENEAFY